MPLTSGSKRKAGSNIFFGKAGKIVENFFLSHASGKILEYVIDSNASFPDTWLPAANPRRDHNALFKSHTIIVALNSPLDKGSIALFSSKIQA